MRLGDGFVQGSSIMPQKRNPVASSTRARSAGRALRRGDGHPRGRAQHAVRRHRRHRRRPAADRGADVPRRHPGGRPPVGAMASAEFDAARSSAARGRLDHDHGTGRHAGARRGLSFTAAHGVARRVVEKRAKDPSASLSDAVAEATAELPGGTDSGASNRRCWTSLSRGISSMCGDPRRPGARGDGAGRWARPQSALDADRAWLNQTRDGLRSAAAELHRKERGL